MHLWHYFLFLPIPLMTPTVVHMVFDDHFFFCLNVPCSETEKKKMYKGQKGTSSHIQKFTNITAELLNKSDWLWFDDCQRTQHWHKKNWKKGKRVWIRILLRVLALMWSNYSKFKSLKYQRFGGGEGRLINISLLRIINISIRRHP